LYIQSIEAEPNRDKKEKSLKLQDLEIVEVRAPQGKIIQCAKQGSTLVPLAKIAVSAMGKYKKYPEEEFRQLQELKQKNRKSFDADPKHGSRLEELKKLKHNYERSQEMFESIKKVGLTDAVDDLSAIIKHLLWIGERADAQSLVKHPSQLEGRLAN